MLVFITSPIILIDITLLIIVLFIATVMVCCCFSIRAFIFVLFCFISLPAPASPRSIITYPSLISPGCPCTYSPLFPQFNPSSYCYVPGSAVSPLWKRLQILLALFPETRSVLRSFSSRASYLLSIYKLSVNYPKTPTKYRLLQSFL